MLWADPSGFKVPQALRIPFGPAAYRAPGEPQTLLETREAPESFGVARRAARGARGDE